MIALLSLSQHEDIRESFLLERILKTLFRVQAGGGVGGEEERETVQQVLC